ncbi:DUF3134 domain-containing protein [Gloeocapsopsis dulcis]|uniref:DUF3134 domain-containing protein n=1 Tax=Gloeocapsopsis dulcis AAB1 = 1H9 TaxID=1433147 RepID=A0A6N8FT13_9CHRO|nr:DUF3134 domain-containing protein [Gloeocapsopsis dulcis]MUL35894.1 hypothetical protein [Gloeocapsopsis dulcis AAB1 = 1H9]WNN87637.1 DUF3134 domain-containing protein [Gloeocapsopsis dulcis]
MRNSALREEPRDQRAAVIPVKNESSLLDWLESSGRLIARDNQEPEYSDNEEEIAGLMDPDDMSYDLDDDDAVEVED